MRRPKENDDKPVLARFVGVVENTKPAAGIGWIRCTEIDGKDSNEVLFFHTNYTVDRKLPASATLVKGEVSRTADPTLQDRALNIEVIK
jgi:hypothetical protein